MNKVLAGKVRSTISHIREIWPKLEGKYPFIAFSTGKDSLAMAALMYEALEPEKPICLYAHHDLEFPSNLEYLETLKERGFVIQTVHPFLEYFELIDRGIGFLTLSEQWCIPVLMGTGFLEWLQQQGARSPQEGVMFRGMSRSEHSHKWHSQLELYKRLNVPCFNPILDFTKDEILEILKSRYGLPLNPLYENLERTSCICCFSPNAKREKYSEENFPGICERYFGHTESMILDHGLLNKTHLNAGFKDMDDKQLRRTFSYWRRSKKQNVAGAIKRRISMNIISYCIRDSAWIKTKHLQPVDGKWMKKGNEIRFWGVNERVCDALIKRMINCLDCGFCVLECFPCRRFDRKTKTLQIEGCIHCGKCLNLKHCKGWHYRFWRRVIKEEK